MNTYYISIFNDSTVKQSIRTVYLVTDDVIVSTVLNTKDTKINVHNTTLPKDTKEIEYQDYMRLLTYYKCIK